MQVIEPDPLDFQFANIGPWTVLRFSPWAGFNLGQTTSLTSSDSSGFRTAVDRNRFLSLFDHPYHEAEQIHGSEIREVEARSACYPGADGLVSPGGSHLLTIQTADCVPLFIREANSTRYGLFHVGWRGLVKGIVREAIEIWFDGPVEVVLGSGIHSENYEVGSEVIDDLKTYFDRSKKWLIEHRILTEDSHLDIFGGICLELELVDQKVEEVFSLGIDTADENSIPLYSYRRDNTQKRMINWMVRLD